MVQFATTPNGVLLAAYDHMSKVLAWRLPPLDAPTQPAAELLAVAEADVRALVWVDPQSSLLAVARANGISLYDLSGNAAVLLDRCPLQLPNGAQVE